MCGSMADIQSATAEIRRGKKRRKKNKRQDENIMVCPIPQGDHKSIKPQTYRCQIKPEILDVRH